MSGGMYNRDGEETSGCLMAILLAIIALFALSAGLFLKAIPYVIAAALIA